MKMIQTMHPVSIVVIAVILALFGLSVIMLLAVCGAYRRQTRLAALGDTVRSRMLQSAYQDFSEAYKTFGQDTNTPAIIAGAIREHMHFSLFCERFLNNAVSLFVTLGLFGTFLGLSMSVSSLTELISFSNTSEWLGVLDSVGSGLMSALGGMGVAFYTSLVGVACSIVLTLMRAILSPDSVRAGLETEMELWLDHRTAPKLATDRCKDDSEIVARMMGALNAATDSMSHTLDATTAALQRSMADFSNTVDAFNKGSRDFNEFDYNLRGTVERLDVAVRDFSACLRRVSSPKERNDR